MNNIEPAIEVQVRDALQRFPFLKTVVLFGSVAKGTAGFGSDLDIAVEAEQRLDRAQREQIIEALALELGRPLDLIDLKAAGQPLLHQIISTGHRVLGNNSDWGRLIYRNVMENEDFGPLQDRILDERLKRWIES